MRFISPPPPLHDSAGSQEKCCFEEKNHVRFFKAPLEEEALFHEKQRAQTNQEASGPPHHSLTSPPFSLQDSNRNKQFSQGNVCV